MDTKQELLREYNEKINNLLFMQDQQHVGSNSWNTIQKEIEKYQEIRDKIESAIFDVPSNDEIEAELTIKNFNDMNAKEEILKMLKQHLESCEMYLERNEYHKTKSLITATENAIFDLPSEDEIDETASECKYALYQSGFIEGCNYILNYKKQTDDTERKS